MLEEISLLYIGQIAVLFAISVIVGRVTGPIVIRALEMLSSKTKSTLDDRILEAIKVPLESFFFIIVFYFLMHSFPELAAAAKFLESYTFAILILIATFMLSEASGAFIRWYYDEGHKIRGGKIGKVELDLSLLPLVRKVTKLLIYAAGVVIALSSIGFDITGVIAVSSILGIILGLASQETLANIFAGIALQMDRPYHYGDYLRLPSGEIAVVQKIGMRSARLEDLQHNTIVVSNSEFAKMRITNLSLPDDVCVIQVSAELPHPADLKSLEREITAAIHKAKPQGYLAQKGSTISIDTVKPSSVAFTYSFWVSGYYNAAPIKETVNAEILKYARKMKK